METQTRPFQQNQVLRNPSPFFQICLYPLLFAILSSNLHDWFRIFSLAGILQFSESRLQEHLQSTHVTHIPVLHGARTAFGSTLCWYSCCRVPQILGHTKENGSLMLWLPWDPAAHIPQSHHTTQQSVPLGLSCTSYSQPFPFLWLPEVCTMYLQTCSSWKVLTNRKFSHFPGWKPNLCIRNACPYFQFSPFPAIPPLLSGNAQLRLSGL